MGLKIISSFLCLIFVLQFNLIFSELVDDDSIVIEAQPLPNSKRSSRQLIFPGAAYPPYSSFLIPTEINNAPLATTGPCFTSKGLLGKCTSFRTCYPYFKLPELNNWDSWVLGMYDTCSYFTVQGRQMFGVCCTNPGNPSEPSTTSTPIIEPEDNSNQNNITDSSSSVGETVKQPVFPQLANWPPPIPTHPPDHTIPPLPTHPPSPGYPGFTTSVSVWPPATKPTVKPTYKPVTQPPYRPTVKPTPRPTPRPTPVAPAAPAADLSCGAKNGYQDQERIVGGHKADVNEWPWIAALFNGGRQFCGGSLIDNIHILSAAHCVAHMSSWDVARLTVRLGDHNIKTNSEIRHVEKRVKRVVRHRGFDSRTLYNDIAILTLDSPVTFSKQIRPVCLPSASSTDFSGHTATVIGWGSLRESGPQPAELQEVSIPVWSNRDCQIKYGHAAPGGIVEHMLCAGQANRDSCSGDSGGPLMVNSGRWTQAGIVSWGIGCGKGQYPGVYTRVEKFLPWINRNLK